MATFVMVHGAMHGGWCWRRVNPLLRAAGHEIVTPTLTGLGERIHLAHPDIDLETHVQDVLAVLEYEDLNDIILVGHSYGTLVNAGVIDRASERVAHVVYLDGTVANDGQALLDFFPPATRAARLALVESEGDGWRLPASAPAAFGIKDATDAAWVGARLAPQPFRTFTQPLHLTHPAGFGNPKTFIACLEAPAAAWRDAMIDQARREPGWRYRALATGHDAMITAPQKLASLLLEIVGS